MHTHNRRWLLLLSHSRTHTFMTRKGRKEAASKSLILYLPLMRRAKREERNSRHLRFTVVLVSQNLAGGRGGETSTYVRTQRESIDTWKCLLR